MLAFLLSSALAFAAPAPAPTQTKEKTQVRMEVPRQVEALAHEVADHFADGDYRGGLRAYRSLQTHRPAPGQPQGPFPQWDEAFAKRLSTSAKSLDRNHSKPA